MRSRVARIRRKAEKFVASSLVVRGGEMYFKKDKKGKVCSF